MLLGQLAVEPKALAKCWNGAPLSRGTTRQRSGVSHYVCHLKYLKEASNLNNTMAKAIPRVVLVTGAAGGIGRAKAASLLTPGHRIFALT
jgi:hypothetical protein